MEIKKMTLDQFVETMLSPMGTSLDAKQPVVGVSIANQIPSGYVIPTVTIDKPIEGKAAPLLLVSAAGAMGKSMASMAIASLLGCPRLDLSQTIVGQNSHSGILANALKIHSFARYTELLDAGEASLVIDALDEAPLRSGDRAFFAFMESLATEANLFSAPSHQIVVLGRPQNIELFSDLCEDLGVAATVARIDSLALSPALNLIDQVLSASTSPTAPHRTHPGPARDYWEAYLVSLGAQLSSDTSFSADDWDTVSDFLGYPPVLAALAPMLEQNNYISALQSLRSEHQGSGERSDILLKIVDNLLDREANKVQSALRHELEQLDEGIISNLYTHNEQISRILGHLGVPTSIPLPASLPDELRPAYEDRIGAFVSDHPFLDGGMNPKARNVVFSDYLRALVDSKVSYVNVISEEPLRGKGLLAVGPFYAYFMHAIARQADAGEQSANLQNEDYVNDIIKSWVAAAPPNTRGSSSYHHEKDDSPELLLTLEDIQGQNIDELSFAISEPSGVLTLESPVYDMAILSDHGLHISSSGGSVTLGPRASIMVRQVETDKVEEIMLRGHTRSHTTDRLAAIVVAESLRIPGDYRIVQNPPGCSGFIVAPGLDNRWKSLRPNLSSIGDLNPARTVQALIILRRILLSFRGSVQGSPAIHPDKFSRHVVGRSSQIKMVSDAMTQAGLFREGNGMLLLNQERLTELGVSYDVHQSPDWQTKIYPVLVECMKHDSSLASFVSRRDGRKA